MCLNYLKIRNVHSAYGVRFAHLPCGKCSDCRKRMRAEWSNRLSIELEHYHTKLRWRVGFVTLTYNDEHLPHIPEKFFKDGEYDEIPCFSYDDIKRFITCLRNWLYRERGQLTYALRWFIACEYGEHFHRPHYHGILIFHPTISDDEMWRACSDAWTASELIILDRSIRAKRVNHGFISGFDAFVPKDTFSVGGYCAKYVCKDIEFMNATAGKFDHLKGRLKNELRHYQPFHKQSIGFGSSLLNDFEESMYTDGFAYSGHKRLVELPLYLKRKLLYTTTKKYNLTTHRFEFTRRYTKWFFEHKDFVYEKKFKQAVEMFSKFATEEYWRLHPVYNADRSPTGYENLALSHVREIFDVHKPEKIAEFYVCYFGVPWKNCHVYGDMADALLSRYNPCADNSDAPLIPARYHELMTAIVSYLLGLVGLSSSELRSESEELYSEIRAFFNSQR